MFIASPAPFSPGVARAQDTPPPRSDRPLAEPVIDAPVTLRGNRATSWRQGGAQWLLLEREVTVEVGSYGFRAERAVVRIDEEPQPGRTVRHLSVVLDNARPLRGRGPVSAEAPRLLVTASTTGDVNLFTDLVRDESAEADPLVADARARIDRHLLALSQPTLDVPPGGPLLTDPQASARQSRREAIGQDTRRADEALREELTSKLPKAAQPSVAPRPQALPAAAAQAAGDNVRRSTFNNAIFPAEGVVTFAADRVVFDEARSDAPGQGSTVALMGHVRVMYQSFEGDRSMTLTADNAVVFLEAKSLGEMGSRRLDAGDVRGVYLEDNVVATDGQYTVRAPRVYYDLARNKAVVLEAVMFTYDVRRQVPIYVRAEKLRQESVNQWTAQQAQVTTSEFAQPHFAIAASKLTFTRRADDEGVASHTVKARDVTFRVGDVPLFYWPGIAGEAQNVPLRRIEFGSSNNGLDIRTAWDLFALSGQPAPEGVELSGQVDFLGDHGPALGLELDYDQPRMFGAFDAYAVLYDTGEDEIGNRRDIPFDGETRGYALWRHRQYLENRWELSLELAYVSDETFLEEFFRDEADAGKPYETLAYLKRQEDDWMFTFLASYDLNDFVPQTWLLQSPGYRVDKLPELGYYRVGTSLWEDRLTYFSETRVSRMKIRPGQDVPADRGFTNMQSMLLFGFANTTSFDAAASAAGLPDDYVLRGDTRHELAAPFKLGPIDAVPYIVGRFTAYDDDFAAFSPDADDHRVWGSVGVRLHTQISRVYDRVQSAILDLHRIRHIIEPSLDLFYAGTTVDPSDLPVYDPDVEMIDEGAGLKVGLRNTLQTQRGGPGAWRSVDWLVLNTDFVVRGGEADFNNAVIARYFSYRPEYSVGGDHFHSDLAWMISDTLAMAGELIYSFESDKVATWRVGTNMQHTPRLTSYLDYAEIDRLSSRLLAYGFTYRLTLKYTLGLRHTIDLAAGGSRDLTATLERRLPSWRLLLFVEHDDIDDEQTVGVMLLPEGLSSSRFLAPRGVWE